MQVFESRVIMIPFCSWTGTIIKFIYILANASEDKDVIVSVDKIGDLEVKVHRYKAQDKDEHTRDAEYVEKSK